MFYSDERLRRSSSVERQLLEMAHRPGRLSSNQSGRAELNAARLFQVSSSIHQVPTPSRKRVRWPVTTKKKKSFETALMHTECGYGIISSTDTELW